jgi:nucleotide-binding universal stress UspA family protein
MMRRILVGLDHSVRAPAVFRRACELAYAFNAELILFHVVVVPQDFPAAGAGAPADVLRPEMLRESHERLMNYVRSEPELSMRVVVKTDGTPARAVMATAEELDVDLVVIGSHGYHGIDRVLGTTAGSVANRAKRDVLVVHRDGAPLS